MEELRFTVMDKKDIQNGNKDTRKEEKARTKGFNEVSAIERYRVYFVRGSFSFDDINLLQNVFFCDSAVQYCKMGESFFIGSESEHLVETIAKKRGGADEREALRLCKEFGIRVEDIVIGNSYRILGNIDDARLHLLAKEVLCVPASEYYATPFIKPQWESSKKARDILKYDIKNMKDSALKDLSNTRRLSLDLDEMQSIRSYFASENREASDAELEMISQSWSEHCVHKTFRANIRLDDSVPSEYAKHYPDVIDGLLKTYIKRATDELAKPYVISSFIDNAGVIEVDDEFEASFKVETHNHPSSIEPFGGANTGVGGVIRDIMGVSHKPIATTDVLCFAPPDMDASSLPENTILPYEVREEVIKGIADYGNKMGIPTVNGDIHYHPLYATNPLVYCGCVGISRKGLHKRCQKAGDHIISLGKRVGRDGIGGATFSSMLMGDKLEEPPVQRGEPIVQKKVLDALIAARDEGLYSAITDCGAGGFSSSIGEMAEELGCKVDLERVKTQKEAILPYEIWISETQERMVVAVPPQNVARLLSICKEYDVEATDLGVFTGKGRIEVFYGSSLVIDLSCKFLKEGLPKKNIKASYKKPCIEKKEYQAPTIKDAFSAIVMQEKRRLHEELLRQYDYEVQGATLLKPYMEASCPQSASVLRPIVLNSKYAIALANSLHIREAMIDPYRATLLSIDELIRRLLCVGVDPSGHIGLLDNFCLGSSKRGDVIFSLLEMCRAAYDGAMLFGTPFISGKDSFNNEYKKEDGTSIAVPPSLLISGIARIEDIDYVTSSTLKKEGSYLYLVGLPKFSFCGSLFEAIFGLPLECAEKNEVPYPTDEAPIIYKQFYECIKKHLVFSSKEVSEGGILRCLYKMSLGGELTYKLVDSVEKVLGISMLEALFGETAMCLIAEVEDVTGFEACVDARYRRLIGSVIKTDN